MPTLNFADLTAADIKHIAQVHEPGIADYPWLQVDAIALTPAEQTQLDAIGARLMHARTSLMNEATIWSRAIYPLLVLAEQDHIQAWAGVPLRARYPHIELQGIADGILGSGITGVVEVPYLIIIEAQRALEFRDPRFQLYGALLAAARLNWENDPQPEHDSFGCYTISDSWTFIHARVQDIDTNIPRMTLESSREYVEKLEATTIVKILKRIVSSQLSLSLSPQREGSEGEDNTL